MNAPRLTEAQVSQALRAYLPDRAQAGLRERILEAAETTTQQRALPSFVGRAIEPRGLQEWTGRLRTNRWAWVLVAAVLTLLAAAAILVGSPRPSLLAIEPPPAATPTAIPTPTIEISPSPAVQSLELTWTKVALDGRSPRVAWLGDRFVLVDDDSVSTSADGASWYVLQPGDPDPGYSELLRGSFASWQDDVVGWWNPEDGPDVTNKPPVTARDILRIVRPPAAPTETTPFKGRIQSLAVGPAGIVVQVHSLLDTDAWIASKLGDDWVSRYEEVSFKDGILEVTMKRGRGLKVVWADQGFEPGDFMDAGFGWYSPDGEQWTLMPAPAPSPDGDGGLGFVTGFGDVVGVSDGFIARGSAPEEESCSLPDGCSDMWHSSDGVTWRNLGSPAAESLDGEVLPWMGGALVTDGVGRFDAWTAQGRTELPMTAELPPASLDPAAAFGTGSLGLVAVRIVDGEILFTPNGVEWNIQPMPADMADDGGGRRATTVAVGERSVMVTMWAGTSEAPVQSIWRGTLEP